MHLISCQTKIKNEKRKKSGEKLKQKMQKIDYNKKHVVNYIS